MQQNKNPLDLYTNFAKIILGVKLGAGVVIVSTGVISTLVVLFIIYKLFTDTSSLQLFNETINSSKNLLQLIATEKDVTYVSNKIVGYVVIFVFLGLGTRLSLKIISVGFKLIDKLEFKFLLEKIWKEWLKAEENKPQKENISKLPTRNRTFK